MTGRAVLVVGGTGFIGSDIAAALAARGDEVTIASRSGAGADEPLGIATVPRIVGDYADGGLTEAELETFDAVVMAAGQDIRHVADGDEDAAFWDRMQRVGVPAFAARAKRAGVGRFVQIGSYYHQLMPALADEVPYVAARRDADEGARELSDHSFAAITLNPPSIVGAKSPRAKRRYARMAAWLRGEADEQQPWAPPGGTNYLSVDSLTQAVLGALDRGEGGKAYLIGDESLSYQEFFQRFVDLSGGTNTVTVRDASNPLQPDRFIVQGRGARIEYEPDSAETELLGYRRHDVARALAEALTSTS